MSQGKILLVDDSPSVRQMLEDTLSEDGYVVYSAENGKEAIELLKVFTPNLVITDVSMPEMDGFALVRHLKDSPGEREIPVIMLTAATEEKDVVEGLGLGAADYIRKPFSPAELGLRVKNILRSENEKNRLKEIFARHTSAEVMEELLSRGDDLALGGELREVAVLFADVRGFTRIAANQPPEAMVRELNRYLSVMSEAVMAEGGTLDKFLGDGLMAVFGAPLKHDDDPLRAVRCAVALQRGVAELNREREAAGLMPMRVGVGVTFGQALVGTIGSALRTEYTAMGDCVNMASRLQERAEGGEIIVSEAMAQAVSAEVEIKAQGKVRVKGKDEPLAVFSVTY